MTLLSQGLGRQRGGLLLPLVFTVAASLKHFKLWFVVFFWGFFFLVRPVTYSPTPAST